MIMGRYSEIRDPDIQKSKSKSTNSSPKHTTTNNNTQQHQQQQHSTVPKTTTTTPNSKSHHTLLSYSCVTKSTTVRTLRKMSCFEGVSGSRSSMEGYGGYGADSSDDEEDDVSSSAGFSSRSTLTKTSKTKAYSTNSLPRGMLSGETGTSASLPTTKNSIFQVASPQEIAFQLTLIDAELFRAIEIEELIGCGWTRKEKEVLAPHVLAFTRRFNHLSFWVVEEILNGPRPKDRAQTITTFLRLSTHLSKLNNLHSLFAIVSALQSASIYRLSHSWELVGRKDKATLQKFVQLFSDQDNWAKLRERLDSLRLPCVPYIGVYLTDLVYLSLTHGMGRNGSGGGSGAGIRLDENYGANNIFRMVTTYQAGSSYSHLPRDYTLQVQLRSVRYIDELLKFVEDYNFKRSLSLEPPQDTQTHPGVAVQQQNGLSPPVPRDSERKDTKSPSPQAQAQSPPTKFVPGHKKSHSWIQKRIPWITKKTV